jgi:hypothetical protein
MMRRGFVFVLPVILMGCSEQGNVNDSADTRKRIGICEEVMKRYIVEANTYERDRKRLIGSCHISQKERSVEQWQCILDDMNKNQKYDDARNRCGKSPQ